MTQKELDQIISGANDELTQLIVYNTLSPHKSIMEAIELARQHTPIDPEPVEIPLDDWEPQAGDVVEWPNGERYEVDGVHLMMPNKNEWRVDVDGANCLIRAAKCRIWRNQ